MELETNKYYHLYNRSNNRELLFRERENYIHFLTKYRKYLEEYLDTLAYCLMPNHFHFLIYVKSEEIETLKKKFGILLSSYTKAINKAFSRSGSLFQQHSKSKLLSDENNLLNVIAYIHQNPLRKNLVQKIEDWEFSSYIDYIGIRNGTLVNKSLVKKKFNSTEKFRLFSSTKVDKLDFIYNLEATSKVDSK